MYSSGYRVSLMDRPMYLDGSQILIALLCTYTRIYIYIYIMLFEMPLGDCALIVIPAGVQSPFCSWLCVYIRNRLAVHFKQFL